MGELIDMLGRRKVAQANAAQIEERNVGRQAIAYLIDNSLGQKHLAPMGGAHDARGAIHLAAEEIVIATLHDPQVQAAAHPERNAVGRRGVAQCPLKCDDGVDSVHRVVEGGIDSVAGHLHDDSPVPLHGDARQGVMPRQRSRHPLRFLLPEPGAAFDIGE